MKCSRMIFFTASLLHTSRLRHWHAKSCTFWMFIISHLFCIWPHSLAVSKLPLCIKSIGGRNRSARVVSFLSIAPPFLNSCSCLTATQKDEKVLISHKSIKLHNKQKTLYWLKNTEQHDWPQIQKLMMTEKKIQRGVKKILGFKGCSLGQRIKVEN